MIDLKSLYTHILVEDEIAMLQKLVLDHQTVILNAHFIIDFLRLVNFDQEYFQQINIRHYYGNKCSTNFGKHLCGNAGK